ncbi:hypothetical protein G6L46_10130 [Agrobacterium rhizogenes]|uniref:alginate O-acetyltransferase AlgX-related protein n=1 Tax=Rhizobium rhizogenes TaxID=359 RepID=UPI0015718616|nr:hypothetical protein [Rhizobium rhizogenes]NTF87481.1 hypothetical protein [Rhizobium rhizogenes]
METIFEPEKAHMVLHGLDGWLFLTNDTNKVIDQTTGRMQLTDKQIVSWDRIISERRRKLDGINCRYLMVIAPNKESVRSDKLPIGVILSESRPVRQLQRRGIDIFYRPDLLEDEDTYSKTDTHWSDKGGHLYAKALIQHIAGLGLKPRPIDNAHYTFSPAIHYGDLGRKLTPPTQSSFIQKKMIERRSRVTENINGPRNTGKIIVMEGDDKSLPRAVIFGDSFCGVGSFCDFMAQSFSRTTFIWGTCLDHEFIGHEKPDIVISQMAERFLIRMPEEQICHISMSHQGLS